MSTPKAPDTGPTAAAPTGLVTLIVGEVGRAGSRSKGPLRREPDRKRQREQFSEPVVLPLV